MAEITNTATIKVVLDADGVEVGLRKIDQGAAQTGRAIDALGKSTGVNNLADGAEASAAKFTGGTKSIIDSIQRRTAAMDLGKKGTTEYYAALAESKGINPAALKPYLDQLEAVTRKTAQAAEAQKKLDDGAAFITGLRARTQEIGKSAAELASMRAAQLGVSESAQPLIEQLRAAEEAASGLGGTLGLANGALQAFAAAAVAALSISAVAAGIQTAIDALAGLDDMAQKSGSSVESLSRLQKVAQMTGQDFAEVNSAVNKLSKGMGGLDVDSNKVLGALKTLGVSATDSAGKLRAPSEVMIEAAKKFQNYADGAGKARLANDLFKGSGADLLPFLNDVAESVDSFTGSSASAATAASEFGDNMGAVQVHIGELWTEIASNLLPALIKFSKYVKELSESDRFKKFMVDAGKAATSFAEAMDKIAPAIVPATKIVAAYFGLFVIAPNAIKLAIVSLDLLWTSILLGAAKVTAAGGIMAGLNTTLFGMGLAAQFASGWMARLTQLGGVLFAAFAGWEIGKYLHENFAEARIAGLMFVEALLVGFENIKYGCAIAFEFLASQWEEKLGYMKLAFAFYVDSVAKGLDKIGASDTAKDVAAYAESVRDAGVKQVDGARKFATASNAVTVAHEKEVKAIKATIAELLEYEAVSGRIVEAETRKPPKKPEKPTIETPVVDPDAGKRASEYANLVQAIQSKIEANKLELATSEAVSESQKLGIKLNLELTSGKIKLTAAQVAATKASLAELAVTEQKLKLQAGEKSAAEFVKQATAARVASGAALQSEYALYGKVSDARDLAAVELRGEAELQKKLAEMQKAGLPVTEKMIEQMTEATKARVLDEKATLAQTKALGYASKLADDNRRFAAESITDERARAAALLEIDADMWRQRIALAGAGTEAQKLLQQEFDTWYKNQTGKPAMDEWRKSVQQYDDIFRNGFADMLNNGKDGWKSFTKSLVTTFKTSVADQIYKMFIKPLIVQVVGSVVNGGSSGGSGGSGLLSMGQSIYEAFTKGSSNGSGMLDMGKKLFEGFGGAAAAASSIGAGAAATGAGASAVGASTTVIGSGFGGIGASAGALTAGVGSSAVGVGGTATVGAGGGVGAAGAIPIAGWIAAGMAMSNALYKQGWDAQNGTTSATTIPFNAPMLNLNKGLQKLGMNDTMANMFSGASTVSRLFGRKNPEVKDFGIEGTFGASGFDGKTFQNILEKGGLFRKDKNYTKDGALDAAGESTFDDTIKNLMTAVKGFGAQMGIEASQIDKYTKAIKLTLTGDEAKNQELITGLFGDIGNDLAKLLIPTLDTLTAKGEKAGDALQRIAIDYAVIDTGLASLGKSFGAVGIGSLTAREKLVELSGGIDNFSKGISYFSQNYQTEAERMAALGKTVDAAFASLEITAPKTRDEFKNLVLGLDLTTEKGAKTFAGLMNIQEAFATLNPAIEATATAVRSLSDIANERAGLQDQFDQLRMTPEEYRQQQLNKQRDALDPSNRDLFDNVQNGQIANSTNVAAANAAEVLKATNKGYQDQIDVFVRSTMKAADVRKLEIAGMDATTVALYDLLKGYQTAAASATAAKDAADKLASTNKGYQDQIDTMLKAGMTAAEVRKLETKGMDASTLALYDKLKGLEADKVAKDKADQDERDRQAKLLRDGEDYRRIQEQLADDAKRAAEQLRDAWQSVTDSIFDEVKRIRGLAAGDGASTLASVQAEFATRTAQAQSGNQDAAKLLPSISQKLIELAEANATSLLDLQRIRARTAASLDATGAILAAKFGLTLPSLAVGTNYLPSDRVIQAHEGERVIPAADNRALMQMINRPASADASAASQQQASDNMVGLRAEVRSIAISNAAMAGMLKRVIKDDKLQTEDA